MIGLTILFSDVSAVSTRIMPADDAKRKREETELSTIVENY